MEVTVTICNEQRSVEYGTTLSKVIEQYSPYGDEPVICRYNGIVIKNIDGEYLQTLQDGDILDIYPLIIGG